MNAFRAIKMPRKNIKEFIFENYYRRTQFTKENSCYSVRHQKKKDLLLLVIMMPDARNAKETYYKPIMQNENKKLVKRSKINTEQTKYIENPNIVDIKSVITKYPKTFHKLSQTIRQAKKVSQTVLAKFP